MIQSIIRQKGTKWSITYIVNSQTQNYRLINILFTRTKRSKQNRESFPYYNSNPITRDRLSRDPSSTIKNYDKKKIPLPVNKEK